MHLGLNDAWNYHINYKNVKILISIEVAASFIKKMSSVTHGKGLHLWKLLHKVSLVELNGDNIWYL